MQGVRLRKFSWSRSKRQNFLFGLFALHLALVVAGAAHLSASLKGPFGRGFRFYDALTGAGDSYSFFAPSVNPQLRAHFTFSSKTRGTIGEDTLETGKSREASFRMGNLAGMIDMVSNRVDLRRALLASLAANRLEDHPEADRVKVSVEEWRMPSMVDYRKGVPPSWQTLHDASFERIARVAR